MAYNRDADLYHLTPRGWMAGDRPPDAVETWEKSVYQASARSKEEVTWACRWTNEEIPRVNRDKLREKHSSFMGTVGKPGKIITIINHHW